MGHTELIYLMSAEEDASGIFTVDELLGPPANERGLALDFSGDDDVVEGSPAPPAPRLPARRGAYLAALSHFRFTRARRRPRHA